MSYKWVTKSNKRLIECTWQHNWTFPLLQINIRFFTGHLSGIINIQSPENVAKYFWGGFRHKPKRKTKDKSLVINRKLMFLPKVCTYMGNPFIPRLGKSTNLLLKHNTVSLDNPKMVFPRPVTTELTIKNTFIKCYIQVQWPWKSQELFTFE